MVLFVLLSVLVNFFGLFCSELIFVVIVKFCNVLRCSL